MAFRPKSLSATKGGRPSFDIKGVALSKPKYVCWMDLMGMASVMAVSNVRAAIFIGKLHDSILRSRDQTSFKGTLFPMVDGCYAVSEDRSEMQALLKAIMKMNALSFIHEEENINKYMLRASIAFGQVVQGADIFNAAESLKTNEGYSSGILLGTPLALAYHAERQAPPFGVWVEESARHFCPDGGLTIRNTFWDWWTYPAKIPDLDKDCDQIENILAEELSSYLGWCERNCYRIIYSVDAIRRHREFASQYFHSWPRS